VNGLPRLLALAAVAASVAANAQTQAAPARKPLLGTVRADDGSPAAGAAVTLWGIRAHADLAVDLPDAATAVADERGRFHAAVIPEVPYCGFALTAGAAGARGCSPLQGWFGAGALVEFVCAPPRPRQVVRCVGGDAWPAHGPLSWALLPAAGERALGPALPLSFDAGGDAYLPEFASARPCVCEARTAAGELLWSAFAPRGQHEPVCIPRPRTIPLRAVGESGEPVAGAAIRVRAGFRGDAAADGIETMRAIVWRELGRTGADGRLQVELPLPRDPFADPVGENVLLSALADGCAESVSGFAGTSLVIDGERLPRGESELRFTLRRASVPVCELAGSGRRLRGARLRVCAVAPLFAGGAGFTHDQRVYEGTADGDGKVRLAGMPPHIRAVREIVLPPDGTPPVLLPPRSQAEPSPSIQLDDAAELRLRLLDAAHGPLAGCAGYLRPVDAAPFGDLAATRFCTDPAGACTLRPWPGDWYLFAEGRGCWLFERCAFASGRRDLELTAQPFAHCTGVLTRAGQPVADAALALVRTVAAAGDEQARVLLAFARRSEERLRARVRTAADGRFDIPFVPVHGVVHTMRFDAAGRRSPEFTCDAAELRLEIQ
jgi:hypothetical protein